MNIRRSTDSDREALLDIWLRWVREMHVFVSEADIAAMIPEVWEYLASSEPEFWVVIDGSDTFMGFIGLSGNKLDALFLAPEFIRRGAGRRLVRHALRLHGELTVEVNKQNPAAVAFYESCGFVVEGGRSMTPRGGRTRCCTCGVRRGASRRPRRERLRIKTRATRPPEPGTLAR